MKKIQYGILSTASIVERFVRAVQSTTHSEVAAIASRSLQKAQAHAQKLQINQAYGTYQELFEDPNIDIIYIATPNENHYQDIKNALNQQKHVLCEKPFTLTSQQARDAFQLAQEKQCFLMEAQKSVFLPTTLAIKNYIQTQELGPLLQIDISSSYTGRHPEGHWMNQPHQGGALIPSGSYTIEYLNFLMDQPADHYQAHYTQMETKAIDEVSLNLKYGDVLAHSFISVKTNTKNTATFFFEKGYVDVFEFWKARGYTVHQWETNTKIPYPLPVDYEMVYEVDHVYKCLKEKRLTSPIMSPQATITCVEMVEAIQKTALI